MNKKRIWIPVLCAVLLVLLFAYRKLISPSEKGKQEWTFEERSLSFAGWSFEDPLFRNEEGKLCVLGTVPTEYIMLGSEFSLFDLEEGEVLICSCAVGRDSYDTDKGCDVIPCAGILKRTNGKPLHVGTIRIVSGLFLGVRETGVIRRRFNGIKSDFVVEYFTTEEKTRETLLQNAAVYDSNYNIGEKGYNQFDACDILTFQTDNGLQNCFCSENLLKLFYWQTRQAGAIQDLSDLKEGQEVEIRLTDRWFIQAGWQEVIVSIKKVQ